MLTMEESYIITNRMHRVIDLYIKEKSISVVAKNTGLNYYQINKILAANNYYHKLCKNNKDTIDSVIFLESFKFLLDDEYSILNDIEVN